MNSEGTSPPSSPLPAENRAAIILESITDAFFSVDESWRFTYVNRHAARILDKTPAQLVGEVLWDVYPGLRGSTFESAYRRTMHERESASLTAYYPDHLRWYEVHSYPAAGGMAVYFRDVTERREAEQALRESEERYRTLFESIDEGFCVIEVIFDEHEKALDYRFLEINPAFEKHTGLVDAAGKTMRQIIPDHDESWFEIYGRVVITGEPIRFINEAKILDKWFDLYAFRLGDQTSRKVAVLFTEITQRIHTENLLRANESRLQLAVEIAQMGMFEVDLATTVVTVNEPGRAIYGWAKPITTFAQVQSQFHPDDRDAVMREVAAALNPEGPRTFEVEQRIIRVDGQVRWIRTRGRALFESIGDTRQPTKLVGTYLDITERKSNEDMLREADRRKDEFLALLAHELRNPLAPLRNGLQVMRLAANDATAVAKSREIMERQLTHMVRLIDDLLDISRISRNKMELRLTRVGVAEIVAAALEIVRPTIDAHGHQLTVELPATPVYLFADLTRMSQVLGNLLTNSAKYTERGGHIWLSATHEDRLLTITVRDTGIGIPPESLASIFEMFSQVDRSLERSTGGLGIGLALVKGLVELHGGSVVAESGGPHLGSTFIVRLPIATEKPVGKWTGSADTLPAAGSKRRVLIVDDNHDAATSMAMMLQLLGSEVQTAADGMEAVDVAHRFRPDIVLMDIGMPRLNGYDATQQIRDLPGGESMRIIAVTGWGQEADRRRSRDAGCDGHLVKPVALQDLENLLASIER